MPTKIDPLTKERSLNLFDFDTHFAVSRDVSVERLRQFRKWGYQVQLPQGTGRSCDREALSDVREAGDPETWRDVLREEYLEAVVETDPKRLYDELIQVAAVAMQWCEKLKSDEYERNQIAEIEEAVNRG